jgi:hypothetical protein
MKQRCFDSNVNGYQWYGGRGIAVCEEWLRFEPFKEWSLANGYKEHLTIDRIDVYGNYEPSNCKWVTQKEQNRNKRNNHLLTAYGETKTLGEWSEITGLSMSTICNRIRRGLDGDAVLFIGRYPKGKGCA